MNAVAESLTTGDNNSWTLERMQQVLEYAHSKNYQGYSKFDAMNSPFLEGLFGHFALTRLVWIQAVNRTPIHLRKIFGVKPSRNPKGIANFIKAYSVAYQASSDASFKDFARSEVASLYDWMTENSAQKICEGCQDMKGAGWGYNFPWENPSFYAPRFFPNAIVTVFAAEAFLSAYQAFKDPKYLESAKDAAEFMLSELPVLIDEDGMKCLGYTPAKIKLRVININSVIAGFLAKLSKETGREEYLLDS